MVLRSTPFRAWADPAHSGLHAPRVGHPHPSLPHPLPGNHAVGLSQHLVARSDLRFTPSGGGTREHPRASEHRAVQAPVHLGGPCPAPLLLPPDMGIEAGAAVHSLLRLGAGLAPPIAINRVSGRSALEQVLEQGRQRLADGIWVVVFPEGTRVAPREAAPLSPQRRSAGGGNGAGSSPRRPQRRGLLAAPRIPQASRHHPPRHWEADREHGPECGRDQRPCGGVDRVHRA